MFAAYILREYHKSDYSVGVFMRSVGTIVGRMSGECKVYEILLEH